MACLRSDFVFPKGRRPWSFAACYTSAPAQAGSVHSKSGSPSCESVASAECAPTAPLLSLYFRCAGEDPGVGWGVASPAFPADANPLVSLPCSVGLMAPRRVCGPDGQAPEPRPSPPSPPRNSVQGVQHLERQCLAFPSPWTGKCPCSCERCSSLPNPSPAHWSLHSVPDKSATAEAYQGRE